MTIIPGIRSSTFRALALFVLPLVVAACAPGGEEPIEVTQSALVTGDTAFALAGGTGSYNTITANSWNSHGGVNHSTALATVGTYRVDFPLLGDFTQGGGDVQVSGTNQGPVDGHGNIVRHCKVVSWGGGGAGTTLQVFVNCYSVAGSLAIGTFYVSFQRRSGNIGAESGYAWADQPTVASYTPSANYQWNSAGGSVTVTREGTGVYLVNFPAQVSGTRMVQATAYGAGGITCAPAVGSADTTPRVRCYDANGAPADSRFTVAYSRRSVNNMATYSYATVQLGSPGTVLSSYGSIASQCGPDQQIQTPVTVTGGTAGSIHVHFPQMSVLANTEVIAMAYDTTSRNVCNVLSKGNETGGAFANIECWQNSNTRSAAGTKIVVTFSSSAAIFC